MTRSQLDRCFAVRCALPGRGGDGGVDLGAQAFGAAGDLLEGLARERQHGAAGKGGEGDVPLPRLAGEAFGPDVVTVGQHAEGALTAVLALRRLAQLAVGDQHQLIGGAAGLDDRLPRPEVPLFAAARERFQNGAVLVAAQQGQFGQLQRDDPYLRARADELDTAVAQGVCQTPVDAERAPGDVDPWKNLQQPA
jgi:hypothetical protein